MSLALLQKKHIHLHHTKMTKNTLLGKDKLSELKNLLVLVGFPAASLRVCGLEDECFPCWKEQPDIYSLNVSRSKDLGSLPRGATC